MNMNLDSNPAVNVGYAKWLKEKNHFEWDFDLFAKY